MTVIEILRVGMGTNCYILNNESKMMQLLLIPVLKVERSQGYLVTKDII